MNQPFFFFLDVPKAYLSFIKGPDHRVNIKTNPKWRTKGAGKRPLGKGDREPCSWTRPGCKDSQYLRCQEIGGGVQLLSCGSRCSSGSSDPYFFWSVLSFCMPPLLSKQLEIKTSWVCNSQLAAPWHWHLRYHHSPCPEVHPHQSPALGSSLPGSHWVECVVPGSTPLGWGVS